MENITDLTNIYKKFSILIASKNRLRELKRTLEALELPLAAGVNLIICDDGSIDNSISWITNNYPNVHLISHEKSQGYISSRNELLSLVTTPYAISLDDDANFITADPFPSLFNYFKINPKCGLIAFRIHWGPDIPEKYHTTHQTQRVQGFVGCGHAWRMEAWRSLPNYPSWYKFYGEEDFASFHLFKSEWEVIYLPQILVHHRANLRMRKNQKDYGKRLRSSLRAGWFNVIIFYPIEAITRSIAYSIFQQIKNKILKGDMKAFKAMCWGLVDIGRNLYKLRINRAPLSRSEFLAFKKLPKTKIYWDGE